MTRTGSPDSGRSPAERARPGPPDPFAERCARLGPTLMRDLGLTDIQAAGLLGNLGHETGGFRHLQEIVPVVPGSRGGWGIAQWTGRRRVAMEDWCRAKGLDPASEAANEGFLVHELTTTEAGSLRALRQAGTLEAATEVFCRLYERPGIPALTKRIAWARRALDAIRGTPPLPPSPGPIPPARKRPLAPRSRIPRSPTARRRS